MPSGESSRSKNPSRLHVSVAIRDLQGHKEVAQLAESKWARSPRQVLIGAYKRIDKSRMFVANQILH